MRKIHKISKNGKELEGAGKEGEERKEGGEAQVHWCPPRQEKRWFRPGVVSLHENRRFQKTLIFLIRKLAFVQ